MFQRGIVQFFDAREGKQFGFITVEGQPDVFFHWETGCGVKVYKPPVAGPFSLITDDPAWRPDFHFGGRPSRIPVTGDGLVYRPVQDRQGRFKALSWALTEDWQAVADSIEPTLYRVRTKRQLRTSEGVKVSEQTVWMGEDLAELDKLYSTNDKPDPLKNYKSDLVVATVSFQRNLGDDWKDVNDFRTDRYGRRPQIREK